MKYKCSLPARGAVLVACTLAFLLPVHGSGQQRTAFEGTFPQYYLFRGEMGATKYRTYEQWSAPLAGGAGLIRKFMDEELPVGPQPAAWLPQLRRDYPRKLLMLHLNGEARQAITAPGVAERYFPGHFVHEAGGLVAGPVATSDTVLRVGDIGNFRVNGYAADRQTAQVRWLNQLVRLVRLDTKGDLLWYESEIVEVTAVDKHAGTITVRRGEANTAPLSFVDGRCYAANIAGGYWGGIMFFYNLSATCPRDRNGRTAAELNAEEIGGWFARPGGVLRDMDGIAFDVNYFDVSEKHARWDVDNDGQADGGIVGGRNLWREGDWAFLRDVRARLGENRTITADGQHPENQAAVGVLDGIESEGLVSHLDAWRGISRTLNTHAYWERFNTRPRPFRYVVMKFMSPDDAAQRERLERFTLGVASCVGAYVTEPSSPLPDQYPGGSFGCRAGELVHTARSAPNLLEADFAALCRRALRAENCTVQYTPDGVVLTPATGERTVRFTFEGLAMPGGDVTFFLGIRSLDPLDGFAPADRVPRIVYARMSGLPDLGGGKSAPLHNELYGMASTVDRFENSFYYRRVGAGPQRLEFTVDGSGGLLLDLLSAHNAPDVLIRKFEKVTVCANPSLEPQTLTLDKKQVTVGAVDAVLLPR